MSVATKNIFIVGAKRTPFGAFGGKLRALTASDLAVHSSKAALAQAGLPAAKIDDVYFGNVMSSSLDGTYLSRHVALKSGVPIPTPALTVNRLCGSGFEAIAQGAEAILLGKSSTILCGGSENMSQAPMVIDGISARWGVALGKGLKAEDSLWAGLSDSYAKLPMGLTAEKLAEKHGITRQQCDEYGLRSQVNTQKAQTSGIFKAEMAPVEVKGKKGPETMDADEHPRANAKIEDFAKLKSVFKENGTVTAGTASGICDGAASLIVVNDASLKANNLKPLSRVVAWSRVGCEPSEMGIGPVEAIRNALKASGLKLQDMDIVEINEAFGAQYLACEKVLGLDPTRSNVNGGAIAIGHPLGASGGRIMSHLTHELVRTGKKYAVGAACIGGGQGIAIIIENAAR